jgi:hypothetical protein
MTTLQAIQFAAKVQIASRIKAGGMIMIVTEIKENEFKGISEYVKLKNGKDEPMSLRFEMLLNPHYNKNIEII